MFFAMTIQSFIESIQNNSLLATLLGGGVIVTFFAYIKQIFQFISNVILSLISFEIIERFNLEYCSPIHLRKLMYLLNTKSKILWMKKIELLNSRVDESIDKSAAIPHGISIHLLYGKLVYINKYYETQGMKIQTFIEMRVFFCSKKKFSKLLLEDIKNIQPKESQDDITIQSCNQYLYGIEKKKRKIDSIYSPDDSPKKILNDVKLFIKSEELYHQLNIPYKRNYLFYGAPGTGKSSCIQAIASEINWDILCIDISKVKIDEIVRTCSEHKNTIFVFEDIDAISKNIKSRDNNPDKEKSNLILDDNCEVTLSQLLNLTDGLITPEKCICIFTSNHVEDLDEAFLRDGRMDYKVEFKNLNKETAKKMIMDMTDIQEHRIFVRDNIQPSHLQELILKYNLGEIDEATFLTSDIRPNN